MNVRATVASIFGSNGHAEIAEADAPDALTLIHADHEEVSALFEIALDESTPAAKKRAAVQQICDALTVHAKMEEALFYPALRKAGKTQERDSVLEAAEEHGVVKDLIAKIKRLEPRDETLNAKLTVLKENVEHHVKEEESEIFNEARRVMGNKLQELGEQMQAFKDRALRKSTARPTGARKTARKTEAARRTAGARKKTAARGGSR